MKKLLILSLLAVSGAAMAQVAGPTGVQTPPTTAPAHPRIGAKEMQKINEDVLAKLNLTDDQKTKIKAHQEEMKAKLKELRKSAKTGGADAKEKLKEAQKENREFMKTVLTKEQLRDYAKLRREAIKEYETTHGSTTKP